MNNHIIEKNLELNKNYGKWLLYFEKECKYFDGHFENFKILPALIQIDYAVMVSKKYLNLDYTNYDLTNLKFIRPITPKKEVSLEIMYDKDKQRIEFNYYYNEILMSKGSIGRCIKMN